MDEFMEKGDGWEDIAGPFPDEARAAARRTGSFLPFAYGLTVVPGLVVVVYVPVVIDILADLSTTRPYDPAKATIVLLVVAFAGLGFWQAKRVKRLRWLRNWYRKEEEWGKRQLEEMRQERAKQAAETVTGSDN